MQIMYIDDEELAVKKFRLTLERIGGIGEPACFMNPLEGIEYAKTHKVDLAFLDIEMPEMQGLNLAAVLKEINVNTKIVFVTAYEQYALEAFGVNAIGYLLKPYSVEKLEAEIQKAGLIQDVPEHKVSVQTMPNFDVFVDGALLHISRKKVKELLALMIDRHGASLTAGQAIACLWEDRPDDESTKALFRMTAKRLKDTLVEAGIEHILGTEGTRSIDPAKLECDYYRILDGDKEALDKYQEEYMTEYSWAEETNARLSEMKYEDEEY